MCICWIGSTRLRQDAVCSCCVPMKRSIGYRIIFNGEKWLGIKWLCMMPTEGVAGFWRLLGVSGGGVKGHSRFAKEITHYKQGSWFPVWWVIGKNYKWEAGLSCRDRTGKRCAGCGPAASFKLFSEGPGVRIVGRPKKVKLRSKYMTTGSLIWEGTRPSQSRVRRLRSSRSFALRAARSSSVSAGRSAAEVSARV